MPDGGGFSRNVAAEDVAASHSAGFDAALDKALLAAGELAEELETDTFTVNVEFWAEIKVTNPGQIQQYGVTLTPQG